MKLPRELDGEELAKLLKKFGYRLVRQTGSHMRLAREGDRITIPRHKLKVGTLNSILNEVARQLGMDKKELVKELFKKR